MEDHWVQRNTLRGTLGGFLPPETPPPPQELKSFFGIFAALNETVINTVMRVSTETVV